MWCWVCVAELFLALPSLVVGASYLSLCPHYLLTPVWLVTHSKRQIGLIKSAVFFPPLLTATLTHLESVERIVTITWVIVSFISHSDSLLLFSERGLFTVHENILPRTILKLTAMINYEPCTFRRLISNGNRYGSGDLRGDIEAGTQTD